MTAMVPALGIRRRIGSLRGLILKSVLSLRLLAQMLIARVNLRRLTPRLCTCEYFYMPILAKFDRFPLTLLLNEGLCNDVAYRSRRPK